MRNRRRSDNRGRLFGLAFVLATACIVGDHVLSKPDHPRTQHRKGAQMQNDVVIREESGPDGSDTIVIHCIDNRYSRGNARRKLPAGFTFTFAGASRRLVESDACLEELHKQIKILLDARKNIHSIVVADHYSTSGHHGCAAYGSSDSRANHIEHLHAAERLLKKEYPSWDIQLRLQDIDIGTVEEIAPASAIDY